MVLQCVPGKRVEMHDTFGMGTRLSRATPCAVIPTATRKQAQQIVKAAPFLLLSREQKVEAIEKVMCKLASVPHQKWRGWYSGSATAILNLIESK